MVDIAFYLVTEDIARRSGVIESRYRTKDGRFILDNKDLSRIRLTSEEYVSGLQGVEMITKQEAMILIKENNYTMGAVKDTASVVVEQVAETPETEDEQASETEETEQPAEEESVPEEEVGNAEDALGGEQEMEQNNEQTNEEEE